VFNLEMACTDEMLTIAEDLRPYQVTFVPERREEITTEGGLNLASNMDALRTGLRRLANVKVRTSVFIDPDVTDVHRARDLGADAIELHTGQYAIRRGGPAALAALAGAAAAGEAAGLAVHAGHGLTVQNVGAVAAIPEIEELNIGHAIVGRALLLGIADAVHEMRSAMDAARAAARLTG
jgi:pyridoxine 5-phosphate synthase